MGKEYNPGIYRIYNKKNNRCYVGGTKRLKQRRIQHFSCLNLGNHANKLLQDDYNIYGKYEFEFQILEKLSLIDEDEIVRAEQKWIDLLNPEYNINKIAGKYIGDYIRTDEAKKKRHSIMKGRKLSDEHKKAISIALFNSPKKTKGRIASQSTREKLRQANLGENNPNYGLKRSPETRAKMAYKAAKTYPGVVSPDGVIYTSIHNLQKFCQDHGLDTSNMRMFLCDKKKSGLYKGWKKYNV